MDSGASASRASTVKDPAATAHPPAPAVALALHRNVAQRPRQPVFARERQPVARIDERRLSADFGVSRTPLREALEVLAEDGLVTTKVCRGVLVEDGGQTYLGEPDADGEEARTLRPRHAVVVTLQAAPGQRPGRSPGTERLAPQGGCPLDREVRRLASGDSAAPGRSCPPSGHTGPEGRVAAA